MTFAGQPTSGAATGLLEFVATCRDRARVQGLTIEAGNVGGFGVRVELHKALEMVRTDASIKSVAVGPTITLPVGYRPKSVVQPDQPVIRPAPINGLSNVALSPVALLANAQVETAQAHDAYLRFATAVQAHFARAIARQNVESSLLPRRTSRPPSHARMNPAVARLRTVHGVRPRDSSATCSVRGSPSRCLPDPRPPARRAADARRSHRRPSRASRCR